MYLVVAMEREVECTQAAVIFEIGISASLEKRHRQEGAEIVIGDIDPPPIGGAHHHPEVVQDLRSANTAGIRGILQRVMSTMNDPGVTR